MLWGGGPEHRLQRHAEVRVRVRYREKVCVWVHGYSWSFLPSVLKAEGEWGALERSGAELGATNILTLLPCAGACGLRPGGILVMSEVRCGRAVWLVCAGVDTESQYVLVVAHKAVVYVTCSLTDVCVDT